MYILLFGDFFVRDPCTYCYLWTFCVSGKLVRECTLITLPTRIFGHRWIRRAHRKPRREPYREPYDEPCREPWYWIPGLDLVAWSWTSGPGPGSGPGRGPARSWTATATAPPPPPLAVARHGFLLIIWDLPQVGGLSVPQNTTFTAHLRRAGLEKTQNSNMFCPKCRQGLD